MSIYWQQLCNCVNDFFEKDLPTKVHKAVRNASCGGDAAETFVMFAFIVIGINIGILAVVGGGGVAKLGKWQFALLGVGTTYASLLIAGSFIFIAYHIQEGRRRISQELNELLNQKELRPLNN